MSKSQIRPVQEAKRAEPFAGEFSLLCWNVHKQNLRFHFHPYFREILERYGIDLIALQEVKMERLHSTLFDPFYVSFAPNIRLPDRMYGVMNGSRIPESESFSLLSLHRESMIRTRKSAVYSYYPLANGEKLMLLNVHAINFRGNRVYRREIETIFDKCAHHKGALIVTGDFNSWNLERMGVLMKLSASLELKSIEMEQGHLIKSFMKHKLDHIFYRGLELIESGVIDVEKISDHNALYARFRVV